ncbi:hypothetical protein ACM64Y_13510 [Novispirillum sp. DQ9]|uniref:hypothetical protein n=1 Tax=Novispirillum sp. DQ9 TaxID=3398612 RepID=UPI003C7B29F2
MARSLMSLVLLGAVAVAVAGCGVTRLSRSWSEPHAARSFWAYAGAGKPFLVEARNLPPAVTAEGLAAAFPAPPTVAPPARYTVAPADAAYPEYRFVLLFGAPAGVDGADACADRAPVLKGGETLQAAFCHRERVLAEVRGEAVAAAFAQGAASPAARALLYDVVRHLVPPPEAEVRDLPDPPPL